MQYVKLLNLELIMTNEEIYAKAQELGAQMAQQFDALDASPEEVMSVLGYATALIVNTYAMQQLKPVEQEVEKFAEYIKKASSTLVPLIASDNDHN